MIPKNKYYKRVIDAKYLKTNLLLYKFKYWNISH